MKRLFFLLTGIFLTGPIYADNPTLNSAEDYGYTEYLEPIQGAHSLSVMAGYESRCTTHGKIWINGEAEEEPVKKSKIKTYRQSGKTKVKVELWTNNAYLIVNTGSRGTDFVLEGVSGTELDKSGQLSEIQALDKLVKELGVNRNELGNAFQEIVFPLLSRKIFQDHVFEWTPPEPDGPTAFAAVVSLNPSTRQLFNNVKVSIKTKILGVVEKDDGQKIVLGQKNTVTAHPKNLHFFEGEISSITTTEIGYRLVDVSSGLTTRATWKESAEIELHDKRKIEEFYETTSTCKLIDDGQVLAKNQRLNQKGEISTSNKSALDLEFWQSIKDSNDPDMFRAYLTKYPEGEFVLLAKINIKRLSADATSANTSIPNLDYGQYHALVIGNNDYRHLSDLRSAINDARDVARLLENDYGFSVTRLENASRAEIVKSIVKLRGEIDSQDNVLLYYAGHGWLDEEAEEGYWLPVDARQDDPSNWLMTKQIVSQVRAMKAKHVMVVADSCFSGTLTRGIKIEQRTPQWLTKIVKKKARISLTSGGLEPVMDSGGGNNSVFAAVFLSLLRENDGVLDSSQLFSQLRPKVMVNSDQTPEYGDIHKAGHDGGDFLFVRQ